MKNILTFIISLLLLSTVACGGIRPPVDTPPPPRPTPVITPTPVPTPTPSSTVITAGQVFSNTNNKWIFMDGFGHIMTIVTTPIVCPFGDVSIRECTVWHYTKGDALKPFLFNCAGYWNPHTVEQCAVAKNLDELYFVLRHDFDGAWRCIGFTYINYTGDKYKVQILQHPGQAPPYTIIPASSINSDPITSYDAIVQPLAPDADLTNFDAINASVNFSSPWNTDASTEMLGTTNTLVSLQHEGCVTERWNFSPDGLDRVVPIINLGNNGVCLVMDPNFTMTRIN